MLLWNRFKKYLHYKGTKSPTLGSSVMGHDTVVPRIEYSVSIFWLSPGFSVGSVSVSPGLMSGWR